MNDISDKDLVIIRQKVGLYSISELCSMFGCGRGKIDSALNTGLLKYISPNNKERFVYLTDFLNYMENSNKKGEKK